MGSTADSTEIVRPTIKGIKFTFGVGQRIFCQHQNQLYDAKILKADIRDGKPMYFVHYQGWNKKWDEWVPDERIMDYNEENLKKVEEMKNSGKNSKRKSAQKRKSNVLSRSLPTDSDSQSSFKKEFDEGEESVKKDKSSEPTTFPKLTSPENSSPSSEKDESTTSKKAETSQPKAVTGSSTSGSSAAKALKKQTTVNTDDEEVDEEKLDLLGIELPPELAKILVDDWEYVEVKNMLVNVPSKKTVDEVLREYIEDRKNNFKQTESKHLAKLGDWVTEWSFRENAAGIKRNFNHIFGAQNLYRIERLQFAEILKGMEAENKQEAKKNTTEQAGKKSRTSRSVSTEDFPNKTVIEFDFTHKYGPIHLLRSFFQFDHVLVHELRPDIRETTLAFLLDFLEFLNEHREEYFSSEQYFTPPLDYSRKALSN